MTQNLSCILVLLEAIVDDLFSVEDRLSDVLQKFIFYNDETDFLIFGRDCQISKVT